MIIKAVEKINNVELLLVGDGKNHSYLKKYVAKKNLKKK